MILEEAIVVTSDLNYSSDRELEVVYALRAPTTLPDLSRTPAAICAHWREVARCSDYCWSSLSGPRTGLFNPCLNPSLGYWPPAEEDHLYRQGINCVKFLPGFGFVLWGDQVRARGLPLVQKLTVPSGPWDLIVTNVASVGVLKGRGVIFNQFIKPERKQDEPDAKHTRT